MPLRVDEQKSLILNKKSLIPAQQPVENTRLANMRMPSEVAFRMKLLPPERDAAP